MGEIKTTTEDTEVTGVAIEYRVSRIILKDRVFRIKYRGQSSAWLEDTYYLTHTKKAVVIFPERRDKAISILSPEYLVENFNRLW